MPEHESQDLAVLLEIVKYLQARQEQMTENRGELSAIAELLREVVQVITAAQPNNHTIHIQDALMNDYYHVGQAGAVGPNSTAIGQNFSQVWSKQAGEVDLNVLASIFRAPELTA
jgi:hypothetical protein